MRRRIGELTLLFVGVFGATFLLSKMNGPPAATLDPVASVATLLVLQPPDEQIEIPFLSMRVREIGDSWHAPRSGRRKHEGQDIFAPLGTPVYSATNGMLIRIGNAGKGGNAVSVLGAGGRVYYYAHLSRFVDGLRVGDSVTPETVIGYVGITGNARGTPAHLHFGVYDYAGAMNPLPLLRNRLRVVAGLR